MDTLIQSDTINVIQGKVKHALIQNILEESIHYLNGSQVMELNRTLNKHFEGYEIFVEQNIELHENYAEENKKIVEIYLSNKKLEGLSPRTITYYGDNLHKFIEYEDKPLQDVTTQDIREYFSYVQSLNNCSNCTLDNIRRCLNTFFNTINHEGYIQKNPMARIKKIKSAKKVKKPFTDFEIEKMRDELSRTSERTKSQKLFKLRDQALFELLLSSGIRIKECVQLNKSDIDLENKTFIVLGKGNKERQCYFSAKCQFYLSNYLNFKYTGNTKKYADSPALFISKNSRMEGYRFTINGIETRIRELGRKCGVQAHPHKFRRTFATNLVNKGVPIEQIKELLGHSNLDTTMIYAIVDQDQVRYNHRKYAG